MRNHAVAKVLMVSVRYVKVVVTLYKEYNRHTEVDKVSISEVQQKETHRGVLAQRKKAIDTQKVKNKSIEEKATDVCLAHRELKVH